MQVQEVCAFHDQADIIVLIITATGFRRAKINFEQKIRKEKPFDPKKKRRTVIFIDDLVL